MKHLRFVDKRIYYGRVQGAVRPFGKGEKAGLSIVETVEASPAKAKQVRRFANYYLPDAVNVLEQYAKLARQGVRGENAASIRAEVERNAASIATAFENQLDALYAAESMDLSADLTVLQNMMKGQGLS